jgi:hypothetical protein
MLTGRAASWLPRCYELVSLVVQERRGAHRRPRCRFRELQLDARDSEQGCAWPPPAQDELPPGFAAQLGELTGGNRLFLEAGRDRLERVASARSYIGTGIASSATTRKERMPVRSPGKERSDGTERGAS